MSSTLLSDVFVFTVNNAETEVHLVLTRAGIAVCNGKSAFSYRMKFIHLQDVIGQ